MNNEILISINGQIFNENDAFIPINDRAFLFAHGVFETILFINNNIVLFNEHINRLEQSCEIFKIKKPNKNEILNNLKNLIIKFLNIYKLNNNEYISIKILISAGNSLNFYELKELLIPNIIIICKKVFSLKKELYQKGWKIQSQEDYRPRQLIKAKSTNYAITYTQINSAIQNGFNDIIYYNKEKIYTEFSTASLFWQDHKNNFFVNEKNINHCFLDGITIEAVKKILLSSQYKLLDGKLTFKNLHKQKAIYATSAIRGIIPIYQIDNKIFDTSLINDLIIELNEKLFLFFKQNGEKL